MTIITENIVLSPPVLPDANANNPIIGWHNVVDVGNVSVDTEDPNFPAVNLANPSTAEKWTAADTSEQYITVDLSFTDPIDYVAFAKHNFGSAQIPISVEAYSALDGGGLPEWQELTTPKLVARDGPLILRFDPAIYLGLRVRLQPGLSPARAAVLYAGRLLILQRRKYVGHTPLPLGRKSKVTNNRSESGNFLGRIVLNETVNTNVDFQNLTADWYRAYLDPFVKASKDVPFFFAWRPGDYPDEIGYAWLTSDPRPSNQRNNGMMQVSFSMSGVV